MKWLDYKQHQEESKKASGKFVFVKGKEVAATPLAIRPVGDEFEPVEMVYDVEAPKKNRRPKPGDLDVQKRVLVNAVGTDNVVRVYVLPKSVADKYFEVCEIKEQNEVAVEISASGAAMLTRYEVKVSKAAIRSKWEAAELYNLKAAYHELIGETFVEPAADETGKPLPEGTEADMSFSL